MANPGPCPHPGAPKVDIEDRSYVLIPGLTSEQFKANHKGKAYLLDLGTAEFRTSVGYFNQRYGELGLVFDEVWVRIS